METVKFYVISINEVPITELDSYNNNDLNGKPITIVTTSTTVDEQYIDKTDEAIVLCDKIGSSIFNNYQKKQEHIKLYGYQKGWENMSMDEQEVIVNYYANPSIKGSTGNTQVTQVITHLMTHDGLTYDEALDRLIDKWHAHWSLYLEDCKNTWRDTVKVVVKFLSLEDSADLFDTVSTLVDFYLSTGRLGLGFGDSRDGLLNYIRSDYGFTGTGLEYNNYTLNKGTWEEFIEKLTVSLTGKYYKEIQYYKELLK